MNKKMILAVIIFILLIILTFALLFLFKSHYINNSGKKFGNISNGSVNHSTNEIVNTRKIIIEHYDLSQHKILKSIEILNKDKINTLTNMIQDYETTPEHIKLHVNGKYVVKMPENVIISFDNLDDTYVKYENSSFSDIVSISPEFKPIVADLLNIIY